MTFKLDMVQTLAVASVVPMVGAFFIDFTNSLIITGYILWVH